MMAAQADALSLDELGNVPMSYQHEWRVAEARDVLVVPGALFKWYHIHREGIPVSAELDAEARALLVDAAARGDWNLEYGLNFALLHQAATDAFVITGVWRGHNEMWERIYAKPLGQPDAFAPAESEGGDQPGGCVYELGVIGHERMAWHRYLFSARTEAQKRAWLTDTYSGQV